MSKTILKGIVHNIFPVESFTNFEKRIMYLKESGGGNMWELTFEQNDVNILDSFVPGQAVICQVEIRGREWTKNGASRVFNTLKCVMVQHDQQANDTRLNHGATVPPPPEQSGQYQQSLTPPPPPPRGQINYNPQSDFLDDAPV